MDYKLNNLKEQVYRNFIRGEYGEPRIPSENEVIDKISEITTRDYVPITKNTKMDDISITEISGKFSNIIDDIDILFESVEDESRDVLDQLTNSLKEHNGIKRELKRIKASANDIVNGKLGEEYLQYNFTESFDDLTNINVVRSDPIDTDAGLFTIRDNSSNLVNMNHYINRKLSFYVVENFSPVLEQGFIGNSNAENILSRGNPNSLLYKIITSRPTRLIVATSFQLRADAKPVNINSVGINVDSGVTKGYIRLYYQNGYLWKDVPGTSIQEIKGDSVLFGFSAVDATHIKIEFIKDVPDISTNNEYYINIYEIAIGKSSTRAIATIYSKPIVITEYDNESPVVNNLRCVVDADIPSTSILKVSVAQDIRISGSFVNNLGLPVYADSIEACDFKPYPEKTGVVFLSDILEKQNLSSLIPYRGYDFDWKEIKSSQSFGDTVPEVLEFNFTSNKTTIVNSLFSKTGAIKYGDRIYTGSWPEDVSYTGIYISGWCNSDNPAWDPFLSGLVDSGLLVSGINMEYLVGGWSGVADYGDGYTTYPSGINPLILTDSNWSGQWLGYGSGYPYNYYDVIRERVLRYGDYGASMHGWWRPYSYVVTPTGIDIDSATSGYLTQDLAIDYGEFYFNGLNFYKIYKFDNYETVLDSTIRVYQYEDRPLSLDQDEYNHLFRWKYKSALVDEVKTLTDQIDPVNFGAATFSGYNIPFPPLADNEEYSDFNVLEVRQYKTNFVLTKDTDYYVIPNADDTISGINLSPLSLNHSTLNPANLSFDIKYNYKIKNRYLSTWTSYAIVAPHIKAEVTVTNRDVLGKSVKIIKDIVIKNLDTGISTVINDADNQFILPFDTSNTKTDTHFEVIMHCASDEESHFCAKDAGTEDYFIPKETVDNITVPGGIRFVSRLESLKICDLGTLLYDTPMANDRKCALITDYNNEKFLVVKKPSKDGFPGYIFNNTQRQYEIRQHGHINNKGHYIRKGFDTDEDHIIYTTGSSGSVIFNTLMAEDLSWNNGQVYGIYQNTQSGQFYPLHSTYGHRINLEDQSPISIENITLRDGDVDPRAEDLESSKVGSSSWSGWYPGDTSVFEADGRSYTITTADCTNRGYLFYNTAENLPTFYSISYSTMQAYDEIAKRFLYKIELESDGSNQIAPKVRSIRFEVNKGV